MSNNDNAIITTPFGAVVITVHGEQLAIELLKGASKNTFFGRITAKRGTRNLAVYPILSRFLRYMRLVLHPKECIFRGALNSAHCTAVQVGEQSTNPIVMLACQQILQYMHFPSITFSVPTTQCGTAFQQRVWQAISAIPLGQTCTYSDIARQVDSGSRAVANACGANKLPLLIPCHRVVAKNGIGGFMQGKQHGLLIKQWLLLHEGARLNGVARE